MRNTNIWHILYVCVSCVSYLRQFNKKVHVKKINLSLVHSQNFFRQKEHRPNVVSYKARTSQIFLLSFEGWEKYNHTPNYRST